jgi:hypothetical protein
MSWWTSAQVVDAVIAKMGWPDHMNQKFRSIPTPPSGERLARYDLEDVLCWMDNDLGNEIETKRAAAYMAGELRIRAFPEAKAFSQNIEAEACASPAPVPALAAGEAAVGQQTSSSAPPSPASAAAATIPSSPITVGSSSDSPEASKPCSPTPICPCLMIIRCAVSISQPNTSIHPIKLHAHMQSLTLLLQTNRRLHWTITESNR